MLRGLEAARGLFRDEQFVREPRAKKHKWLLAPATFIGMYAACRLRTNKLELYISWKDTL